ncbi:hypothetical protein LCGC14_1906170 [marine sediment metagenome]|uniref:Uncharacterized protein n=1 Tax=marine sediment metagenome TaxID=412755 RepID=A0A0F9FV63_9ZZZZ
MPDSPESKFKVWFSSLSTTARLVASALIAFGAGIGTVAAIPSGWQSIKDMSPFVLQGQFQPIAEASCDSRLRQMHEYQQQTEISRDRAKLRRDKVATGVHNRYLREQQKRRAKLVKKCKRYRR